MFTKTVKINKAAGYTLLEMAIVIGVMGVIIASAASAYRVYQYHQKQEVTRDNIDRVTRTMEAYMRRYGRYPCPASNVAARGNANYGMEGECNKDDPGYTVLPAGQCDLDPADPNSLGVCSERSADDPTIKVRRGALPFRTLNIAESRAYDGYGNRIQYAVTEVLTVPESFELDGGGIGVVDSATPPQDVTGTPNKVHFLVFSPGPDRNGAHTKEGGLVRPCDEVTLDGENCNTDPAGNKKDAIYRLVRYAEGAGADHYDDFMRFFTTSETPVWRTSDQAGQHITNMGAATGEVLGIGKSAGDETVEIHGNVFLPRQIDEGGVTGYLNAKLICDKYGNNCINASKYSDDPPEINCADAGHPDYVAGTTKFVNRLWGGDVLHHGADDGAVDCGSAPVMAVCDPGTYLVGINNLNGRIQCEPLNPPTTCPATPVIICPQAEAQVHTIPAGNLGDTYQVQATDMTPSIPGDYTMIDDYECEVDWAEAVWKFTGDSGICAFPPPCEDEDNTWTGDCIGHFYGRTQGKAGTMTGNVYGEEGTICEPYSTYYNVDNSECQCTENAAPWTVNPPPGCGLGMVGARVTERYWTCGNGGLPFDDPESGEWGNPQEISNTCTCLDGTEDQTLFCPTGYEGSYTQTRALTCADGPDQQATPGPWIPTKADAIAANCTCVGGTQNDSEPCYEHASFGAGYVGNVTKSRTFDCAAVPDPGWTDWVEETSACQVGSLSWIKVTDAPDGPLQQTNPGWPLIGDACPTLGEESTCANQTTNGFEIYQICACN